MTREQIERAAKEAVRRHFQCNGKYPCEERDYCEFCNGNNSAFDCNEDCGADDFNEGFISGAQWRINSVWHDEKVIPNRNLDKKIFGCGEDVILKPKYRQFFEICEVLWDEDEHKIYLSGERETFFMDDVEIWAYVSDLLPERKEETNGGR